MSGTHTRLRIPALIGGEAHGRPMEWPDPWPVRYPDPDEPSEHIQTYTLHLIDDEDRGLVEFFAPRDASNGMRDGWVRSWLRAHPDWPEREAPA